MNTHINRASGFTKYCDCLIIATRAGIIRGWMIPITFRESVRIKWCACN